MQNAGQAGDTTPRMHSKPSGRVGDASLLQLNEELSSWGRDNTETYIHQRNGSSLLFRVKRRRGHGPSHQQSLTFAALAAVATAYLLLCCFRHLEDSGKPKGLLRSLSGVGKGDKDCDTLLIPGGQGKSALVSATGDILDAKRVLKGAKLYTSQLATTMRQTRLASLSMPSRHGLRCFTNLLRFCVVELSALCSLLAPNKRDSLFNAVELIKYDVVAFRQLFGPRKPSRASMRHIDRMHVILRELPEMDFVGAAMSPLDIVAKLSQLLTLQQIALTQIKGGMQLLALCFQEGARLLPEGTEEECLDALHRTVELRRNQVFQDAQISHWLLEKHKEGSHFGVVGPIIIQRLTEIPLKPHEELLKELLNTPLGLRQQMGSGQIPMQPGVRSTLQGQEATIEKSAPPGHVKVPPRLPMALISPEASVESGHRTGVDASAHHMPGTSATLRMPDTAGSLDVAESGGVSDGPGATGASWRSAVAPVSVESSSSLVLQTSIPPLVSQSRPALATYSGASGFVGMSLPSSSVVASRPVDTTSNQHASGPLDTSTGAETPSLTTIVERSLIYQPIPVQGSGHHELRQREVGPASTENSGWTLAPVGESLVRQWRDRQPPQGSLAWVAAAPRTHVELGEAWPGDPTKHGLWGPNEHGIPLSQPALPRATRRPLFQGPPFAQLYASRESSGGVAVGPSIWSSEGSTSSEGAMRLWTGGPGTPLQLLPALGRGSLANSRWDVSLQRPSGLGRSGLPFKGVPVGEPKGALQETNATRAAGVAQTLFSPASAGFGQGLHSFRASGTDSDGR